METQNQGCHMIGMLDIKGQDQCRRVYGVDGIAPTLTTSGVQRQVKILDTKRLRVRKLTPMEYGILQAFKMDSWVQVVSDSQAYKQFGNAVTVSLFEAIATNIKIAILAAEENRDWQKAREELEKALNEYASLGPAGMYGIKGLTPLKVRLDQREKTQDLFNAIMAAVR